MSNEFYLEISDPSQQRYGSRWGGYFRYKIATATKRMHVNRKVRFDSTRAAVRSSILGFFWEGGNRKTAGPRATLFLLKTPTHGATSN